MISIAIFLFLFPWPRPYDLPCVQIKSLMIWTTLAPKVGFGKLFWRKRLQCKSYERPATSALEAREAPLAGCSR